MRTVVVSCAAAAALGVSFVAPAVKADAFERYGQSWRTVSPPPIGPQSYQVVGGALPDGRMLAVTGNSVFLESGAGTGAFDEVAVFDAGKTGGGSDPAFVTVGPTGRIAVGTGFGRPVVVFDVGALGAPGAPTTLTPGVANYFDVPHYHGAWTPDGRLALTAGDFGSPARVTLLDVLSDPNSPVNVTIVENIAGASAGVAFDAAGRLYTANGFGSGGWSDTGWIKAFEPTAWQHGAADFEAHGTLIGDVLSGVSLTFDAFGNLAVGGGDFLEGDSGYLGVIAAGAIADALAGLGPIDRNDPLQMRPLFPPTNGFAFFSASYNAATGELYAFDGGEWFATVPAPASLSLLGLAALGMRRRRHA